MKHKTTLFLSLVIFLTFSYFLFSQNVPSEDWKTVFEKSGYKRTSNYSETVDYFKKFEKETQYLKMSQFGVSPQGRNLYYTIVSKDKLFTPDEIKKSNKPLILIMNGIHSGEIEGKDASMLLLREMLITKEKENLLNNVNLLVIPIFSVDGHERSGKYNRINQEGPEEMGWRTTAQNLNLNRDFMKADAPEMQGFLKFFSEWLPDFFIDNHTTNGADFQYTLTYGMEKFDNVDKKIAQWTKETFLPYLKKRVESENYLVAPYVGFREGKLEKGIYDWAAAPRFSNGYAAVQNRPGLLVETHMIKPYKERVFATKAAIEAVLEIANKNPEELISMNKNADKEAVKLYAEQKNPFPLLLKGTDENEPFIFKGYKQFKDSSWISGAERITYTNEPYNIEIPFYNKMEVVETVIAPDVYYIPIEWSHIIERIKLHGIKVEQVESPFTTEVERYKFKNVKFNQNSYEGRQTVTMDYDTYKETIEVPAGTFAVKTDQRTVRIILHLLEPKSSDSFVRWGFFNTIFEPKEYFEFYVMEKIAEEMMEENPGLKKEFLIRLEEDEAFNKSPYQRLNFFYERSPYFDSQLNVYPVMRVKE